MTIKTELIKQRSKFKSLLNKRLPVGNNLAAIMGNGTGDLKVPDKPGYIYVTIGGVPYPAYCARVAPQYGKPCWVGVSLEGGKSSKFYQVLSDRAITSVENAVEQVFGYAPASRYEYDGIDPVMINLRAITYMRLGMSRAHGLNVDLYGGNVWTGDRFVKVPRQDIDLAAYVPSGTGLSALVMISINTAGAVVTTKGTETTIANLDATFRPPVPSGTVFVSGCVRVYEGQTLIQEGLVNTDIDDLRFSGLGAADNNIGGGNTLDIEIARWNGYTGDDIFDLPDVVSDVLSFEVNGLLQDPLTYTLTDNVQVIMDTALPFDAMVTAEYLSVIV